MKNLLVLILCAGLVGCATSSQIVTGTARPPIDFAQVNVYASMPAGAEEIGLINAESAGKNQAAVTSALKELRIRAGRLGANGVVIEGRGTSTSRTESSLGVIQNGLLIKPAWDSEKTVIQARAVFVK